MPDPARAPVPILYVHYGEEWIRGSERCLLDLLRHLDPSRFRPIVWCNSKTLAEAVGDLGVPAATARFTLLLDWERPRFDVGNWFALVREGRDLVRRHRARLIHSNSGAPCQWMIPVARSARIPILAHLHAVYDLRGRCIFGLHHATRLVGVSHPVVEAFRSEGVPAERISVIHNGVDPERLAAGDATGLRAGLGIGVEETVITSVGSLIHRKGFDILIEAFRRVHAAQADTRLLIVGEGPERASLERRIAEAGVGGAVHLLGERPDAGAIFRDATDIAVSSSRREALGLTMLEAALFGLPVVATRVEGLPEVLEDGASGVLVPTEDPEALAAALEPLVRDPALRRRFGEAGRARIQKRFLIQHNAAAFMDAYERLLDGAGHLGWLSPWGPLRPFGRFAAGALRRRVAPARDAAAASSEP